MKEHKALFALVVAHELGLLYCRECYCVSMFFHWHEEVFMYPCQHKQKTILPCKVVVATTESVGGDRLGLYRGSIFLVLLEPGLFICWPPLPIGASCTCASLGGSFYFLLLPEKLRIRQGATLWSRSELINRV